MNILDIAVLGLLAIFLLAGAYHGFIRTALALLAFALCLGLALLLRPAVENLVKSDRDLYSQALTYTEGGELVNDVELARASVSSLSAEQLSAVLDNPKLPFPLGARISENIAREAFADQGVYSLGDYFNQTIVSEAVNIFAVLALFTALRTLMGFGIGITEYARRGFPRLKGIDGILGACFGLIHGFLILYLVFLITPILLVVIPKAANLIDASFFGSFFYNSNWVFKLIPAA